MGYCDADPHIAGICHLLHKHFVVSEDNIAVMTTPAANNGHDDVTVLPVISQWFGML